MTTLTSSLTIVNLHVQIISKTAEIAQAPLLAQKSELQVALNRFNHVIEERKNKGLRPSHTSETWKVTTELLIQEVNRRLDLIEAVIDDCIGAVRCGLEIDHDELSSLLALCDERDEAGMYCPSWKEERWLPKWQASSVLSVIHASGECL